MRAACAARRPQADDLHVLGPAEAPLALIGGRHRFRLLVQGERRSDIQSFIRAMLAAGPKLRGSVRVSVDIDPQSFLVTNMSGISERLR